MDNEVRETVKSVSKNQTKNDNWGYMVCFGTIITFIAGIGHVNSTGLIYNDFIIATQSTTKSLTIAHGVFALMLAFGGIILNSISKKYSLRFGGFIGAFILSVGSFSTIFIRNTNELPLTYGVLQGIGFGILTPVCYSMLNYYYKDNARTTAMSICKGVQGVFLMWYPQIIKNFMSWYGFRGTLLIISGITFHTFPAMITMTTNERRSSKKTKTTNNVEYGKREDENVDLLNRNNNSTEVTYKTTSTNEGNIVKKIGSILLDVFHLKVLKDPVYCNICIGQSFCNFSDVTFFVLQPMLFLQYGFDKTEAATCISICAGADVAGRFVLAFISTQTKINTRLLYYFTILLTVFFRTVILHVNQFLWLAIVTGILGLLRAGLHVASPLVISNHVAHEDLPGAYAVFLLTVGLVNVAIAPIIGILKDEYQNFIPAFYALVLCCLPCLILWPIEYILRYKK
ncbi:monocarboxylate transporter 7-like [Galleria mellonella]|uniref:Monocarboxylate transporter 7-like n=1 Tax=Galleria mellonella TaxID=7137 RepID=A0A6J1X0V0_GALME|nr:monocarboxylate transporter 7-like [Galleria mellonella]